MNLLKKHVLSHLRTIGILNVSLNKHIDPKLTFVQLILSSNDMTPSTSEMRKNLKPLFQKLRSASIISRINLKTKLVLILAKREDQTLISIANIIKFSALVL